MAEMTPPARIEGLESLPVRPAQANESIAESSSESVVRVCMVSIGQELFAIDLASVREVFEVESVTPVPGMPSMLIGVTNLRGTVVPLLDLRGLLGLDGVDGEMPFAIILRHMNKQVGVLVDHVPEIRIVPRTHVQSTAQAGSAGARPFISAVLQVEEQLGGVLEVPKLFAQVDVGGAA